MIYRIGFNQNYTAFDGCKQLADYATPQEYLRRNPDNTHLIVQILPEGGLYMVVYRPTRRTVATHPWAQHAWTQENVHFIAMNREAWTNAVRDFLQRQGIL